MKAKHALLQAMTPPSEPLTYSSLGQTAFTLSVQLTGMQLPEPSADCGAIETGKLKPSTRLMSKKSFPLLGARVNSARVTGGIPPAPLHGT